MAIDIIKELNAEHAALLGMLGKIGNPVVLSPAVKVDIAAARSALVAHLVHEERSFYPVMRKDAERNGTTRELLSVMGTEMGEIAPRALAAIDSWLAGSDGSDVTAEFSAIADLLAGRIRREERSLYARYLKLVTRA